MVTDFHHANIYETFDRSLAGIEFASAEEEREHNYKLKQQIELVNKQNLAYVGPVLFGDPI